MGNVQKTKPIRTCKKIYTDYKRFKKYLRKDFNNRCGYCDDLDYYAGGVDVYHIDHFKPKDETHFPILINKYSNLVYSCPYCNRAKSNKWELRGFIDPCSRQYDNHLLRNLTGKINSITTQGKYIFINLKLFLLRHELLWSLDKLKTQKEKLLGKIDLNSVNKLEMEVLVQFVKVQTVIDEFTDKFHETI